MDCAYAYALHVIITWNLDFPDWCSVSPCPIPIIKSCSSSLPDDRHLSSIPSLSLYQ